MCNILIVLTVFFLSLNCSAQLYMDANVVVTNGAIVKVQNNSAQTGVNGNLDVAGVIDVDYDFTNNGIATGANTNTGVYTIGGNWINNGSFNADNSMVHLYNSDKLITGNAITEFYNLKLTGGKKMMTVDASAVWLDLGVDQLLTDENIMLVNNPDPLALIYSTGFVSSRGDGHLQRKTNSTDAYSFPLGTDINDFRMRPIDFIPNDANDNVYGARLANKKATEDGYNLNDKSTLVGGLNPIYYHHLYHPVGTSTTDVRFYYDRDEDNITSEIAHWKSNWNILDNVVNEGNSGSYSSLLLSNYDDFNKRPFILASEREFVYIPNAFTPNGDGINDLFKMSLDGKEFVNFSIILFDRWGNIVFEAYQPSFSWDGTFKGDNVPNGTYIWKMNYRLEGMSEIVEKIGSILVLK